MPKNNTVTVQGLEDTETDVTVEDGEIQVGAYGGDYAPATSAYHTPAQARELAAALLRAADEADWAAGVNTYPDVPAGELRIGDVLRPTTDYRGGDNDLTAACTGVTRSGGSPHLRVTWRLLGSGEEWTSMTHERETMCLMRRGPEEAR